MSAADVLLAIAAGIGVLGVPVVVAILLKTIDLRIKHPEVTTFKSYSEQIQAMESLAERRASQLGTQIEVLTSDLPNIEGDAGAKSDTLLQDKPTLELRFFVANERGRRFMKLMCKELGIDAPYGTLDLHSRYRALLKAPPFSSNSGSAQNSTRLDPEID